MQRNVLKLIPTKSVIKLLLIKQRFIKRIRVILANLWGKQNISMNWYILFNKCSLNQRYHFNSKSSRLMWNFLWSDSVKRLTLFSVIADHDRHHITWSILSPANMVTTGMRVYIRFPDFGSLTSDSRFRTSECVSFVCKYLPTSFHTPVLIQVQHCNHPCYCEGNRSTWSIKKRNPMVSLIADMTQIMIQFAHVVIYLLLWRHSWVQNLHLLELRFC